MKRLPVLMALFVTAALLLVPAQASAAPWVIIPLDCYGGVTCTPAQYAVDDATIACSRIAGFLRVEYDAATTSAPSVTDGNNITTAYAFAFDAFRRAPTTGSSAFATWLEDLYLSVTAARNPPQWRVYAQDPGTFGRIPVNVERADADATCQAID